MSTYTIVGALCGFGVNLFSNAVRKLPYLRKPHEHVLAIAVGGYAGYRLELWEVRQIKQLTARLEEEGRTTAMPKLLAEARKDN